MLNYQPETQRKLQTFPKCTTEYIREYLRLCLSFAQTLPSRNILTFPYDFTINPYKIMYHLFRQINFQISPELEFTEFERKRLHSLSKVPTKDFRQCNVTSTNLFNLTGYGPVETNNPFLVHFSQVYTIDRLLDCLHVYNFLLENYIHESSHLHTITEADWQNRQNGNKFQLAWCKWRQDKPTTQQYNYWVRLFLLKEGIDHGSAIFGQLMSYTFDKKYQLQHPIIKPANRTAATEAFLKNQELAHQLRHYRSYHFLQPTIPEQHFFRSLRNDHGDFMYKDLCGDHHSIEQLQRAVELSGYVHQTIVRLSESRSTHPPI